MIHTSGLTKRYGRRIGIDGVDLSVEAGEIFGFLGPNGAGKTTTIRVLLGFLRADAGEATVRGLDCWADSAAIKRDVGYVPGDLRLYGWMTARNGLDLVSHIRGSAAATTGHRRCGSDLRRNGFELCERLALDPDVPARKMSRGMRQKLGLILALASDPRLIVLDEPTSGLDPLMQDELTAILRERSATGATVFFSSHTLAEVQSLCDRIAIVRAGRIVADESLADLRTRAARAVTIRFADAAAAARLDAPECLRHVERHGALWRAELVGDAADLVAFLHAARPADFTLGPPDLETLFRGFYRDDEEPTP